jgi:hypothetical protein
MSLVSRARGTINALPVRASSIVPVDKPSKPCGLNKFWICMQEQLLHSVKSEFIKAFICYFRFDEHARSGHE